MSNRKYFNCRKSEQRKFNQLSACAAALTTVFAMPNMAQAITETARPADALIETVGVGTRFDWMYSAGNLSKAQTALSNLKIRYVRANANPEGADAAAYTSAMQQMLNTLNVRACLTFGWDHPSVMEASINRWTTGAYASRAYAVEGINESWYRPNWADAAWSNSGTVQKRLWELASPKGLNVYNFTLGGPAGGYYYSVEQPAASQTNAYCTHANIHPYHWYTDPNGRWATKINGLWQDVETPNKVGAIKAVRDMLGNQSKPVVSTEYGWERSESSGTAYPVSEYARTRYLSRNILENFNAGLVRAYIYSMVDHHDFFGIANNDGSLRSSGQTIANMITLLQEPGKASISTGSLNYNLSVDSGMSTTDDRNVHNTEIHRTLLQKSNGNFYLVLWVDGNSHQGAVASQAATLTLNSASSGVNIYLPINGTSAVASTGAISAGGTVRLSGSTAIPDSPLIIEIKPIASGSTNLVTNPSFDAENYDTQTPSGWSEWSDLGSVWTSFTESYGGSANGARHLTHYNSGGPYRVYTYQTKTGLSNGLYTLRAKAKRGSGQTTCQLEAKDYGGSIRAAAVPVSSTYQQLELKDINVTNGRCTVGFWSVGNAGNWAYFDDVQFFKQ